MIDTVRGLTPPQQLLFWLLLLNLVLLLLLLAVDLAKLLVEWRGFTATRDLLRVAQRVNDDTRRKVDALGRQAERVSVAATEVKEAVKTVAQPPDERKPT